MTAIATVYATFRDAEEARRIGRAVIEERLAACANILAPCVSIYCWEGELEESEEVAALFKTSAESVPRLIARIAALHSYEIPAILAWPIADAWGPYVEWVASAEG